MLQSRDPNIDCNINFDLSFAFNQTSNIFFSKILHASFSTSNLPCTNSDIIFYTSALALSDNKVLCILWNQGQAACLIATFQEKTTYKSAPFLSGSGRARDAL